jgi:hypothetical protein
MESLLVYDPRVIARYNPRLAYLLEVVKPKLIPRVYKMSVVFDSGTVTGLPLTGELRKPMSNDAWMIGMSYTVRAPLAWAGSPFKGLFDHYTTRSPFIDVNIKFIGAGPTEDIQITDSPTPLELVAKAAGNPDPFLSALGNWHVIQKDQLAAIDFYLRRTLSAGTETPYEVTLAFNMYEVDGCCLRDSTTEFARKVLMSRGLLCEGCDGDK